MFSSMKKFRCNFPTEFWMRCGIKCVANHHVFTLLKVPGK
jgi:hypothetical protein